MPTERYPMRKDQLPDNNRFSARRSRDCTIVIPNLPLSDYLTEEDTFKLFNRFGPISGVHFNQHECFVEFAYPDSAKNAIIQMNNYLYRGLELKVLLADNVYPYSRSKSHGSSIPRSYDNSNNILRDETRERDATKAFIVTPIVVMFDHRCPRYYPEYISDRIEKDLKFAKCKIRSIPPNEKYEQSVLKVASEYNASIVVVVTNENIQYNSVTVNIFKHDVEEHRNMPLEDALDLIWKHMQRSNIQHDGLNRPFMQSGKVNNYFDGIQDDVHNRILRHERDDMPDYVVNQDQFSNQSSYRIHHDRSNNHPDDMFPPPHRNDPIAEYPSKLNHPPMDNYQPMLSRQQALERHHKMPYVEQGRGFDNISGSNEKKRSRKPSINALFQMLADGCRLDYPEDYDDLIDYLKAKREQLCGPSRKVQKGLDVDIPMNPDEHQKEFQAKVNTLFGGCGGDKRDMSSMECYPNLNKNPSASMMCDQKSNCSPAAAIAAAAAYFATATANASQPNAFGINQSFENDSGLNPEGYHLGSSQMYGRTNANPSWVNDNNWNY